MHLKYQDGESTISLCTNQTETKFVLVHTNKKSVLVEEIFDDRDRAISEYNKLVDRETDQYRFLPKYTFNMPFYAVGGRC